jgi:hypothetical protein
MKHLLSFHEVL